MENVEKENTAAGHAVPTNVEMQNVDNVAAGPAGSKDIQPPSEPVCKSAEKLKHVLDKTIDKCLSTAKFSMFAQNYKSLYNKNPQVLRALYKQCKEQLLKNVKVEVSIMFQEENIVELLRELEKMTSEAQDKQPHHRAWRPTGEPQSDLRAHLVPVKVEYNQRLSVLQQELEEEQKQLLATLQIKQKGLLESQAQIADRCRYFAEAANTCRGSAFEEVVEFVEKT